MQERLPTSYFENNRLALAELLSDNSLVILCAGQAPIRTSTQAHEHFADRSFFYLSGIEQEESILLLLRLGAVTRSLLFIATSDPMHERWNGRRLSREQAEDLSGISEVYYLDAFEGLLADLLGQNTSLHLWLNNAAKNSQAQELHWLVQEMMQRTKHVQERIYDLSPLLTQLRMIKASAEITMLKKAINLTLEGILAMLRSVAPGVYEYQLRSEFEYTLSQAGCLVPAFPTIVASGANALFLHYLTPFDQVKDGDLIQVDLGATVGGLCADISRVFPANGKFTDRQLWLYRLVRQCQEEAFHIIQPGIKLADINKQCRRIAAKGLKKIGLIRDEADVGKYFWHSVSHHLGLDVHDVSNREALLQPGMVLTVEPGIYIPEWQEGMRLEDNILVTDDGCSLLSAFVPREAEEIESLMQT